MVPFELKREDFINNNKEEKKESKKILLDNIIKAKENNNIEDKKEIEDKVELSEKKDVINTHIEKYNDILDKSNSKKIFDKYPYGKSNFENESNNENPEMIICNSEDKIDKDRVKRLPFEEEAEEKKCCPECIIF